MRCGLALAALLACPAEPRAQETIEEAVKRVLPDLFAGFLGVTLAEEISGASLRIDNGSGAEDTQLDTFRLPWSTDLEFEGLHGALHLSGAAGVLLGQDSVGLDTPSGFATVEEEWTMAGAVFGVGWGFPLDARWTLRPEATLALGYLDNDARYNAAGAIELAPLIDGTLVNWDGWAFGPAANLTLERARDPTCLAFGIEGRYTLARTHVFEASSSAQEGQDSTRILAARAELGAPLEQAADGAVLSSWDVYAGGLQLGDVEDEALGFERFLELGVGWTQDLPRLPPTRLGAGWIFGEDVRGFTLGLSFDL